MRDPAHADDELEITGPAKRHMFHVEREVATDAGPRRAWRNAGEHPLSFMFERGQLARGSGRYSPQDRYEAGNAYRRLCEVVARSGRDSTDIELVGGGSPGTLGEARLDAMRRLAIIDAQLKLRDRQILRRLCGEGWRASEAVRDACGHGHYDKAVMVRVVEALDALIEAMRAARSRQA